MKKVSLVIFMILMNILVIQGCGNENEKGILQEKDEESVIIVGGTESLTEEESEQVEPITDDSKESAKESANEIEALPADDRNTQATQQDESVKKTDVSEDKLDPKKAENEVCASKEQNPTQDVEMDWVTELKIAAATSQIVTVETKGSQAVVTLHEKDTNGVWSQVHSANGQIGKNGIGKTKEGDGKTPKGVYGFSFAFGSKENPGSTLPYTQVDNSYYWVDDSQSSYYNKFVTTSTTVPDWKSAENILSGGASYRYVLATDYNATCTPGVGSAIFMHCLPTGGAGCIAIPEESMKVMIQKVRSGCTLVIDTVDAIRGY